MTDRPDPAVRSFSPKPADAVSLSEFIASQAPKAAAPDPVMAQTPGVVPGTIPEIGGRKDGPDPTRYGDWEKNGRCIDF